MLRRLVTGDEQPHLVQILRPYLEKLGQALPVYRLVVNYGAHQFGNNKLSVVLVPDMDKKPHAFAALPQRVLPQRFAVFERVEPDIVRIAQQVRTALEIALAVAQRHAQLAAAPQLLQPARQLVRNDRLQRARPVDDCVHVSAMLS